MGDETTDITRVLKATNGVQSKSASWRPNIAFGGSAVSAQRRDHTRKVVHDEETQYAMKGTNRAMTHEDERRAGQKISRWFIAGTQETTWAEVIKRGM